MREVAIIGAGELGGALAHALARGHAALSIRLIDEKGRIAEGKALDIAQAAPIDGFAARVSGSTDIFTAGGASVVVIADRSGGDEWQGDDGLGLLRRLGGIARASIVICAGAAQRELVERGVRELRLPRAKMFGSAPQAIVAGARALVALEFDASPDDVALSIVGVPPGQLVVAWDDATLAGFRLTRMLTEPARGRLSARIAALWPPGRYALAAAAARVIQTIGGRSRRMASCFVGPDDSIGTRVRAAALPVRLGTEGIADVVLPALSVAERVALDNAMML